MMNMIGKSSGSLKFKTAIALTFILFVTIAHSQNELRPGPQRQQWNAPDVPGDGKVEVNLKDGADPMACRVSVSIKGGANCQKVLCRGESAVYTNSVQSRLAAKKIAMSIAKAHYVHFLQEEVSSQSNTDIISSAIKKEGGVDAGTAVTNGNVTTQSIREQASGLIKGFTVIEDGYDVDGNDQVAYVLGGASCVTQRAADTLGNGNKTNNGANSSYGGSNSNQSGQTPSSSRRRAGADDM
jgi:hypothetical protein